MTARRWTPLLNIAVGLGMPMFVLDWIEARAWWRIVEEAVR